MPSKYVRLYSRGWNNQFHDEEAIARRFAFHHEVGGDKNRRSNLTFECSIR